MTYVALFIAFACLVAIVLIVTWDAPSGYYPPEPDTKTWRDEFGDDTEEIEGQGR